MILRVALLAVGVATTITGKSRISFTANWFSAVRKRKYYKPQMQHLYLFLPTSTPPHFSHQILHIFLSVVLLLQDGSRLELGYRINRVEIKLFAIHSYTTIAHQWRWIQFLGTIVPHNSFRHKLPHRFISLFSGPQFKSFSYEPVLKQMIPNTTR